MSANPALKDGACAASFAGHAGEGAGQVYKSAGFKDCNEGNAATQLDELEHKGTPFDRVYVLAAQPETAGSCVAAEPGRAFSEQRPAAWKPGMSQKEFRRQMSDHVLVKMGLCVMKDDD